MVFRYLSPEKLERAKQKHYESKLRSYKKHLLKRKEKNKWYMINKNLQFVRMSNRFGSQRNVLRWSSSETKEHVLKKLEICMELKEWGHEFITEAIFNDGARCDVLDLTEGTIYEILCSETEEMCEEKIQNYPEEFEVIKILC
ncbi:MAG: hypothetical protein Q8O03_05135 [Nanoarchaeota archaeon]|nr:hypothetical protein [Nanoarchaeota archaeon]